MTLTTTLNRIRYTAAAGQTVFPYTFLVLAASDLLVYLDDAQVLGTNYTVSGVGLGSGGNVTLSTPCVGGESVLLYRQTDTTQPVDLLEGDPLPADSVEGMFDKVYAVGQDVTERVTRAIKIPRASDFAAVEIFLPDPADPNNWNKLLKLKADGSGLDTVTILSTDLASPIVASGDLIRGSAAGTPERLPIGTAGDVATVAGGQVTWAPPVTGLSATLLDAKGDLIVGTAADTAARKAVGVNGTALVADSTTSDGLLWLLGAALHGRCRLQYTNATTLTLAARDGNTLYVQDATGWRLRSIGTGLTAANTGVYVNGTAAQNLAASTAYLVTVFDDAGTLTVDFRSTLTHGPDNDFGVEIASGLVTRTVVGLIRTNSSSQFQDSDVFRGVRSWFHESGVGARASLTADRTTSTLNSFVLLNAEASCSVLLWSGEILAAGVSGECTSSSTSTSCLTGIGLDSTSAPEPGVAVQNVPAAGKRMTVSVQTVRTNLAEGLHAVNVVVTLDNGGSTGTWGGTPSPRVLTLTVLTQRRG